MRKLMSLNGMTKPLWYEVAMRYPPQSYPGRRGGKVPTITFPDDDLRRAFYDKYGDVLPVAFYDATGKGMCDEFVAQQKTGMADGLSQEDAFKRASAYIEQVQRVRTQGMTGLHPNTTPGEESKYSDTQNMSNM
eukprot:Ihof_evm15s6 gene=Ihof_evmTU15s6